MIRPGDRIASVLQRDERLLEVLVSAAPAFERLRNPTLRHVMTRLATVEQAARVAGLDPNALVRRLNDALATGAPPETERAPRVSTPPTEPPAHLAGIAPEKILDVDVRAELERGEEPFRRIMEARRALPRGGVLRVRAIFEPAPLYRVMEQQGLRHWTERFAENDWRVWFYEEAAPPAARSPRPAPENDTPTEEGVTVLDVRGLEPPEPLVRTLAALEVLPPGGMLVQLNERVPQFLLPRLEERGFTYEIREQEAGPVRVSIRKSV